MALGVWSSAAPASICNSAPLALAPDTPVATANTRSSVSSQLPPLHDEMEPKYHKFTLTTSVVEVLGVLGSVYSSEIRNDPLSGALPDAK